MSLQDRVVVSVWNLRGRTLVVSPWPVAVLDLPCLYWLIWHIRGGERRTRSVPFPGPAKHRHKTVRTKPREAGTIRTHHSEKYCSATLNGTEKRQFKEQRLDWVTGTCHAGVVAYLVSWVLQNEDVKTKKPSIELVTEIVESEETAPESVASPEDQFVLELVRRQAHRGRELRRHGLMDHPVAGSNMVALATEVHFRSTSVSSSFEPFWQLCSGVCL